MWYRRNKSRGSLPRAAAGLLVILTTSCVSPTVDVPPESLPEIADDRGPVDTREAARTVDAVAKDAPDPTASAALLATIQSLSDAPLYKDCEATLLIDGPQTYAAMLEAIADARSTVHLETYIFADDEVGRQFAEALIERRDAGVSVRVIYDSFGSRASDEAFFERLLAEEIELLEFNAINPVEGGNPVKANNRTHRKLLIVDGKIAFTGGINLSRYYARSSDERPRPDPLAAGWRDTHVQIRGPAVTAFEKIFAENWRSQKGEIEPAGPSACGVGRICDDIIAVLQAEGGDGEESAIYLAYLEAMRLAKEKIWITQAYFAPDKRFMKLLTSAVDRGVDVRIVVPGFSDTNVVVHASRSRYGTMLRRGIKIYETTTTVLHAKTAVIDGTWSTVGSSNLDYRSFLHNDEVNAVIFGAKFGAEMEARFVADLEQTETVTLEKWRQRPIGDRIKEFFSWTLEYWL